MVTLNKTEAREKAQEAIKGWVASLASASFMPGASYSLTGSDLKLAIKIGKIYNIEVDKQTAAQIFTSVASPLIKTRITNSGLDFIPLLGWAVKTVVSFAAAKTVAEALINYFESRSTLPE